MDFVKTEIAAGNPVRAHESSGKVPKLRTITFETAAADAAGDVKALFRVGAHEIPVQCDIVNDAIAGATDIDLGLYRDDGTVVDKDALMDGTDINAGVAWASKTNGLSALGVEERGVKSFFDIANDVIAADVIGHLPNDSYVLALTFNSEVTAAGTITVHLWTIDQQ